MKSQHLLKIMGTVLIGITALSPLGANAATARTSSAKSSVNINTEQSTGKTKINDVLKNVQLKQGTTVDLSDKVRYKMSGKYPVPGDTSKNIDTLKKATSLLETTLTPTATMADWEKAREQIIAANSVYISYLTTLKSALDLQIKSGAITEIKDTKFIDGEMMVMTLFNGAYDMVTTSWIQSIEQKTGQDVDDEEFAMDTLAKIGAMQIVYNGYVSPLTVVGAQGMLVTEAIEKVYASQYDYANVTLRDTIKDYAVNVLKLTGDDYNSFMNYYLGRLDTDLIAQLNTIKQKNDEAKTIYLNDITVIASAQDTVNEFINSFASLVSNPLNFSLESIVDILGDMTSAMDAVKQITSTTIGNDFRAQSQMATIKQTAVTVTKNFTTLIQDLAYEFKIRKDTTHCRKWKGTDASICAYN
ncbi:hypothetical protein HZA41_00935 [Candidatus Peregrinibacteria bacterium]|nr:hypothetical protein [Candidatus Peregrinibacteria bacterium]